MNLNAYLDLVAKRHGAPTKPLSDRQVAMRLGVSPQQLCRYRQGTDFPDLEKTNFAEKLSEEAGVELSLMLLHLQAERTKSPAAKRAWKSMARAASRAVTAMILSGVLMGYGGLFNPSIANAAQQTVSVNVVHDIHYAN